MGASTNPVGPGLSIVAASRPGAGQPLDDALVDADFEHRHYAYAGTIHTSEAAFLAAVGGARAGSTLTIGPTVVGDELMPNPGFATDDATGWAPGFGDEATSLDVSGGKLAVTVTGSANGQSRWGCALPLTAGRAYRIGARPEADWYAGTAFVSLDRALMFNEVTQVAPPLAAGVQRFAHGAAEVAPMYLGAHTVGPGSRVEQWDDFTIREVVPLIGHDPLALAGRIEAATPAVAADMVLFQADDGGTLGEGTPSQRNRIRIAWAADGHLRFTVAAGDTEQAALDLGTVAPSTRFVVLFSATAADFRASLDGRAPQIGTSGAMPGLAAYRLGASNAGEAWAGSIARLTLFARSFDDTEMLHPHESIAVFGDSTAAGDGVADNQKWHTLLAAGYSPARNLHNAGTGGENSAQMLARVAAATAHRRWTTIFVDRPKWDTEPWIENLKAAAALLNTARWLVLPPVTDSPSGQPDSLATSIADIQAELLADPFFAGHTLDAAAQAAYIAAMDDDAMRVGGTDFTHFSAAGQALQASTIRAFLDARGW